MRLWSIHPRYLDQKGLVALWREGLLAKAVLAGKTRGYVAHPQLLRFKQHESPLGAIDAYLWAVYEEASQRGYKFDVSKAENLQVSPIPVTMGQLEFEATHLLNKLKIRSPMDYESFQTHCATTPHPMFIVVPGLVEPWERGS